MIKVAINGFGRIGRSAFKIALDKYADAIEIVAINDLTSPEILAHLLQYDSAYGRWDKEVFTDPSTGSTSSLHAGSGQAQSITIEDKKYPIMAEKLPMNLHWRDLGVDVVLECTGRFLKEDDARQHILAGAKKVILSAPARTHSSGVSPGSPEVGVRIPTYLM